MATGYQALTEKEKQTLRLIVRGHDAKSTARHLGLSVHTVNERLRDARRKLEVSSSREAARLVLDREGEDPKILGDKQIGEAGGPLPMTGSDEPGRAKASASGAAPRTPWLIAGVVIMSLILGILALVAVPQSTTNPARPELPAAVQAADAEAEHAARDWLELGDQGRWSDSYNATAKSFRKLNSLERWTATAQKVRGPLGAVISRVVVSQENVPAPPAGVRIVRFQTSFANKANAIETVTLAREGGSLKVVGVSIH